MSIATSEVLRFHFFHGAEDAATGDVSIDVLDSSTNVGFAAVAPTSISWCDGRSAGDDVRVAS